MSALVQESALIFLATCPELVVTSWQCAMDGADATPVALEFHAGAMSR